MWNVAPKYRNMSNNPFPWLYEFLLPGPRPSTGKEEFLEAGHTDISLDELSQRMSWVISGAYISVCVFFFFFNKDRFIDPF